MPEPQHGTGTTGAPRAFSLKLASVTQGAKCRTKSTTYDAELELRFDDNALIAIATKHVDDIKISVVLKIVRGQIIPALEAVFGKLITHEEEVTNAGIRCKRHSNGTIEVAQDEYNITALKPITRNKLIGAAPESDADEALVPLC